MELHTRNAFQPSKNEIRAAWVYVENVGPVQPRPQNRQRHSARHSQNETAGWRRFPRRGILQAQKILKQFYCHLFVPINSHFQKACSNYKGVSITRKTCLAPFLRGWLLSYEEQSLEKFSNSAKGRFQEMTLITPITRNSSANNFNDTNYSEIWDFFPYLRRKITVLP